MSSSEAQERTEKATPKRMKEVRRKGQLSTSKDLTAWVGMAAAVLTLGITLERATDAAARDLLAIPIVAREPELSIATRAFGEGLERIVPVLTPMFVAIVVAIIAAAAIQGGIHVKKLAPKWEQFDLVKGVRRVFGMQALWEGAKALMKTAVVGVVLYAVIQGVVPVLYSGGGLPYSAVLEVASGAVTTLLQAGIAAGVVLAIADVFVVSRRNRKRTRMTKKEVRDEAKSTEGDPMIRAQRRSRQLAISRNRMLAAVADSDVVILNPTHLAVALRYEAGKAAPRVVARGAGNVAARIRERAEGAGVPLVHDIELARAVYGACDIGQEIPVELYTAVARLLAFVARLRARGSAGGRHRFEAFASP